MFGRHFEFLKKRTIAERNEWFACRDNKREELEKIRSGEGPTLETSAFQIFRGITVEPRYNEVSCTVPKCHARYRKKCSL